MKLRLDACARCGRGFAAEDDIASFLYDLPRVKSRPLALCASCGSAPQTRIGDKDTSRPRRRRAAPLAQEEM